MSNDRRCVSRAVGVDGRHLIAQTDRVAKALDDAHVTPAACENVAWCSDSGEGCTPLCLRAEHRLFEHFGGQWPGQQETLDSVDGLDPEAVELA